MGEINKNGATKMTTFHKLQEKQPEKKLYLARGGKAQLKQHQPNSKVIILVKRKQRGRPKTTEWKDKNMS